MALAHEAHDGSVGDAEQEEDGRGGVAGVVEPGVSDARGGKERFPFVVICFEYAVARLIAHEVDHLNGRLYIDRMNPLPQLMPVDHYQGTGSDWNYR